MLNLSCSTQDSGSSLLHAGFINGMQTLSCGMWDLVPWPRVAPRSLHWECGVLATGPPGKSHFKDTLILKVARCFLDKVQALAWEHSCSAPTCLSSFVDPLPAGLPMEHLPVFAASQALSGLHFFSFFFFFWPCLTACRILVPWSGIKFTSLAVEMRSLSHRTPGKLLAFTSAACCSSAWSMAPYSLASAVLYLTNLIHPESLCLPFFLQGSPLGSSKSGLGALLGADLAIVTFLITESIKLWLREVCEPPQTFPIQLDLRCQSRNWWVYRLKACSLLSRGLQFVWWEGWRLHWTHISVSFSSEWVSGKILPKVRSQKTESIERWGWGSKQGADHNAFVSEMKECGVIGAQ